MNRPVNRTEKKYKNFSLRGKYAALWEPEIQATSFAGSLNLRFLSRCKVEFMLLHRCEDAEIALHPAGVVAADVAFNHLDQLLFAGKPSAIVTLPFQPPIGPLSMQWATRDILCVIPACWSL